MAVSLLRAALGIVAYALIPVLTACGGSRAAEMQSEGGKHAGGAGGTTASGGAGEADAGSTGLAELSLSFAPQADNILRYSASVLAPEGSSLSLFIWETDNPAQAMRFDGTAGSELNVWALRQSTSYSARVRATSGTTTMLSDVVTFTTSALPDSFPRFDVIENQASAKVRYVLVNYLTLDKRSLGAIINREGEIVWYTLAPKGEFIDAVSFNQDIAQPSFGFGFNHVIAFSLDGTPVLDWHKGTNYDLPIHHDVRLVGDKVYALVARSLDFGDVAYVDTGFQVFKTDGTLIHEWFFGDEVDPSAVPPTSMSPGGYFQTVFADSIDWTHANSIFVTSEPSGDKAYVSFRHIDKIVKVDVESETMEWMMGETVGESVTDPGDYALLDNSVTGEWFHRQHDVQILGASEMLMFDNGDGDRESRILQLAFDESDRTVSPLRAVPYSHEVFRSFDGYCDKTGSAELLEENHLLGTCGPERYVTEFDDTGEIVWNMRVDCTEGASCNGLLYRGIAVQGLGFTFDAIPDD